MSLTLVSCHTHKEATQQLHTDSLQLTMLKEMVLTADSIVIKKAPSLPPPLEKAPSLPPPLGEVCKSLPLGDDLGGALVTIYRPTITTKDSTQLTHIKTDSITQTKHIELTTTQNRPSIAMILLLVILLIVCLCLVFRK